MRLFEWFVNSVVSLISHFASKEIAFFVALLILLTSIVTWAVCVLRPHHVFVAALKSGTLKVRSALADGTKTPDDRLALVDKAMENNSILGGAWKPYRAALRPDPRREDAYINPVDPYGWFALERLPGRGYEKWAATLAGVSLTVGLLFTFIGLSAALFRVGDAGTDPEHLRQATADILRISSAKFITSMAGIVAYIGWTLVARQCASKQVKLVSAFGTAVQNLSVPVTPEVLLLDQLEESRAQTNRLKTLSDDMSVVFDSSLNRILGQRLDGLPSAVGEALGPALERTVEPLIRAVEGMGGSIGAGNHAALDDMIKGLMTEVKGAAGQEMILLADSIRETAAELKAAKSGIGAGGAEFGQILLEAASRMDASTQRMAGVLEAKLASFEASLAASAQGLGTASGDMMRTVSEGLSSVLAQLTEVGSRSAEAARAGGTEFGQILLETATRMDSSTQRMASALEAKLTAIETTLTAGAQGIGVAGSDMTRSVAEGLHDVLGRFSEAGSRSAEAARERAQAELAPVLNELKTLMAGIRDSAEESRGALVAGGRSAAGNLEAAIGRVSDQLVDASSKASADILLAFHESTGRILATVEDAVSGYRTATEALAARIEIVERSMGDLEQAVRRDVVLLETTGNVLTTAGSSVNMAADRLREATMPVLSTLQTMEGMASCAHETLTTVQASGQAMRETATALSSTSRAAAEAFNSYERRFAGVDDALKGTFEHMRDGTVMLGSQVSDVVGKYDEHLGRAIGLLSQGVADIAEAVEDIGAKIAVRAA